MKKLIFAITCLLLVARCSAEIIVVEPDGSGDQPTIQAAIDAAYEGDEVVLSIGTYTGYGNRDIDPNGKAVTIRSTNPNDPNIVAATIINCNGSSAERHRAFYFHNGEDANTILNGLTITNGYTGVGGGIYCGYSSPAITNCTFSGNSVRYSGGAMYNHYSEPIITNCTFTGNSTERGGAMYNYNSNPAITNCVFTYNSALSSGAIFNESSSPVITNCSFTGNLAFEGGAMSNAGSHPVITNCTFSDNSAEWGGGAMYIYYGSTTVSNCTFTGNSAQYGGAMYSLYGSTIVSNCTFTGNSAQYGGAIYGGSSNSVIKNCILWGNTPDQIASGSPVIYSNVQGGWDGVGNIDEDPHFVFDADLHLAPDSPCIEAGDPNYIPGPNETDLDGNPRITGAHIDMGAYEFPVAPHIAVSSRRISFAKYRPQGLEKSLQIRNRGSGKLKWELTEDCQWLEVSPIKGTSSGEVNEVTLTADVNGLSAGEYRCWITIADSNAVNSPVTIDVILHIGSLLHVPGEYSTIQDAIDAAGDWDTVLVADGIYKGIGNRDIDFYGRKIQLKSENGAENCIIDCNASSAEPHRGFYFHSGENADSILDGLTITNGYAENGGGIYCKYSSPAITNCIFASNSTSAWGGAMFNYESSPAIINCVFTCNSARYWGGAMSNEGSNPVVTNCTFSGNSAREDGGAIDNFLSSPAITNCSFNGNSVERGGGAMCNYYGWPTVSNCTFTGNSTVGYCGAIFNYQSRPAITNCTFTGNSAVKYGGRGGAMFNYESRPAITNCTFSGNSAYVGGAMYNYYSGPAITNCTFTDNSARSGGAMFNYSSSPAIINCTFNGNSAASSSGAMYNWRSNPMVKNCILWGDKPHEIANSGHSNPVITYSDVQGGWAGVGNIDIAPCFAEPGFWHPNDTPLDANDDFWVNGDYHLKSQTGRWKPSIYLGLDPTNDGFIDLSDFAAFANSWQKKGSFIPADLNRSGIVDLSDLNLLLDNYLAGYPPGQWVLDDITSPCIDTGDPNYEPGLGVTDLDGNPRIVNDIIDMGAYEAPLGPLDLLIELSEHIDAMNLHKGTANSLKAKLNAALCLLEDDNENNDVAAVNLLEAFINAARAQYDKKIPEADADVLIAAAQEIITLLNGE
jgi:predicted outer membrane repeat protein